MAQNAVMRVTSVHDVNVVAADLDAHVLELDGADGVAFGTNGSDRP